jgi:hypothetical protein
MIQDGMLKTLLSLAAKNVIKFVLPLLLQNFGRFSFILILLCFGWKKQIFENNIGFLNI